MKRNQKLYFVCICSIFSIFHCNDILAQVSINGVIKDALDRPLAGANISLEPSDRYATTNFEGGFLISNINPGTYQLHITYIGMQNYTETVLIGDTDQNIQLILKDDPLHLDNVVVTGNFEPRLQLESSTAITSLDKKDIQQTIPRGTANLLQAIPGTFVDPSAGEVFTRVYTRGISASAEDDMGWFYVSLQEDGLPVSLTQHSYYGPDLFHRVDITTRKLEAVRGGNASITALNAPGGIFNFISAGIRNSFGGEIQLQTGFEGEGNPTYRIDGTIGGPLGKNWHYNIGGHYRKNNGARNTEFVFSKGGQFKFDLTKEHTFGTIKFYAKILDDFTNRYTGVAATNWEKPMAAFGQDFNTTALLMPSFSTSLPDGRRTDENAVNEFNPAQGVHAQDRAFGIQLSQDLGKDWHLRFNLKHSRKKANWQTSISNAFVSLSNPLAYFISGAQFPIGEIAFTNTLSGQEIARVNNANILNGESFEYIQGNLPNDAIIGIASWLKDVRADEWMNETTLHKKAKRHDITLGLAGGFSKSSLYTQGSFGYATYEPIPKMLRVTLENPGQPVIDLSDENGLSNYGGLFFDNSRAEVGQIAFYINDRWKINDKLYIDTGLRYESINHKGSKDQVAPLEREGGVDRNPLTDYDNGLLIPTGQVDAFDFNYNYLSYSGAVNYRLSSETALFGRFSYGNKAPELNYYFNNFTNVPINQKGEVQNISQLEIGVKYRKNTFSSTATLFYTKLKDIGIADFAFDSDDNSVFYTPVQFNSSRTFGMEWEGAYSPFSNLKLIFNGTIQNAIGTNWTVYDDSGTVNTDDDSIIDFSGNEAPFNPNLMFNLGAIYQRNRFNCSLKWKFMGSREANVANAFQLSSYSIFDLAFNYKVNNRLELDILSTNIFNSAGLANFFGANNFGANANGTTVDFIADNPNTSFIVVPVLPRAVMSRIGYKF